LDMLELASLCQPAKREGCAAKIKANRNSGNNLTPKESCVLLRTRV
jgi:hypothetical protein